MQQNQKIKHLGYALYIQFTLIDISSAETYHWTEATDNFTNTCRYTLIQFLKPYLDTTLKLLIPQSICKIMKIT